MHWKLKLIAVVALALTYNQNVWAKPINIRRQYNSPPPEYGSTTTPSYESPTDYGEEPEYGTNGTATPTYGTNGTTTSTYGTTTPTYGGEYEEPGYGKPNLGPFKLCDEDEDGTIEFTNIEISPLPIIPGEYMTLAWEGYSEAKIQNNSKIVVSVRIGEHDIDTKEHDICKELAEESGGNQTCPISPGNFSESSSERVPEGLSLFAGEDIIVELNATNGDGSLLYCLKGVIPIGSGTGGSEYGGSGYGGSGYGGSGYGGSGYGGSGHGGSGHGGSGYGSMSKLKITVPVF